MLAVALGLLWFAANNLNIVRAHIQTPPGTQAAWTPREIDIAQHLTWVNAMKDGLVIGDYHMPAFTPAGLFCPLTWLLSQVTRTGIGASPVYAGAQLLVYMLGMYCILVCLRIFLIPRSRYLAVALLALAAIPLRSVPSIWNALEGKGVPPLFGFVDGFFLPGRSAPRWGLYPYLPRWRWLRDMFCTAGAPICTPPRRSRRSRGLVIRLRCSPSWPAPR